MRFTVLAAAIAATVSFGAFHAPAAPITGTFSGTVDPGSIDTIGIFGTPGADLSGDTISGSFTYDPTLLTTNNSVPPDEGDYGGTSAVSITQTIAGNMYTIGSLNYSELLAYLPPASDYDLFLVAADNYAGPTPFVDGDNYDLAYSRIEVESVTPVLSGIGIPGLFTTTDADISGADEFDSYVFDSNTDMYVVTGEVFQFNVNVLNGVALTSDTVTPEPGSAPLMALGIAGAAALVFRRRRVL